MIAVRLLGMSGAVVVALIGGAYTYLIWGHPYVMIIFTAEALVVSCLWQRKIQRGTGLGLAISMRMIEDMGGTIGFNSVEGEDSTFFYCFPTLGVILNLTDKFFSLK